MNTNKAVYLLFSSFKDNPTNLVFWDICFCPCFLILAKTGLLFGGAGEAGVGDGQIYIIQMANKFVLNAEF